MKSEKVRKAHIKRGQTLKVGRITYQIRNSPQNPLKQGQALKAGQMT